MTSQVLTRGHCCDATTSRDTAGEMASDLAHDAAGVLRCGVCYMCSQVPLKVSVCTSKELATQYRSAAGSPRRPKKEKTRDRSGHEGSLSKLLLKNAKTGPGCTGALQVFRRKPVSGATVRYCEGDRQFDFEGRSERERCSEKDWKSKALRPSAPRCWRAGCRRVTGT